MTKYITISLPETMLSYIEELRNHPVVQKKYHITSKSEFVRRGITMLIDKIERDIKEDEKSREGVPTKAVPSEADHPEAP